MRGELGNPHNTIGCDFAVNVRTSFVDVISRRSPGLPTLAGKNFIGLKICSSSVIQWALFV